VIKKSCATWICQLKSSEFGILSKVSCILVIKIPYGSGTSVQKISVFGVVKMHCSIQLVLLCPARCLRLICLDEPPQPRINKVVSYTLRMSNKDVIISQDGGFLFSGSGIFS
jgi:hypothetical protein